jgi:hypothetical protein
MWRNRDSKCLRERLPSLQNRDKKKPDEFWSTVANLDWSTFSSCSQQQPFLRFSPWLITIRRAHPCSTRSLFESLHAEGTNESVVSWLMWVQDIEATVWRLWLVQQLQNGSRAQKRCLIDDLVLRSLNMSSWRWLNQKYVALRCLPLVLQSGLEQVPRADHRVALKRRLS